MILLVCVAILVALGWPVPGPAQHLDTEGVGVLTDAERAEDALTAAIMKPWTGDLEGMIERGYVRIGVGNEPVFFSYDGAEQQGLSVARRRRWTPAYVDVARRALAALHRRGRDPRGHRAALRGCEGRACGRF